MQKVHDHNPFEDYGDDELKRKFASKYATVHCHGLEDGLYVLSALELMEQELVDRNIDPSEVIGPTVV